MSRQDEVSLAGWVIDKIRADARAEMARELLGDKAKNAAAHHMQELAAQGVWDNMALAHEAMTAALSAIGQEVDGAN